jgi:hypothetical protein
MKAETAAPRKQQAWQNKNKNKNERQQQQQQQRSYILL